MKQALSSNSKQNLKQQGKLEPVKYPRTNGKNSRNPYFILLRIKFIVQNLKQKIGFVNMFAARDRR